LPVAGGVAPDVVVRWLRAAMGVLHSGGQLVRFFTRAARGWWISFSSYSARVLLLDNGEWKSQAQQAGRCTSRGGLGSEPRHPRPAAARRKRSARARRHRSGASLLGIKALWRLPSSAGAAR